MGTDETPAGGPDLRDWIRLDAFPESGVLAGQVDGAPVLLVRRGGEVLAVAGACTHYGAPLQEGLVVGDTIRCAWHHACFSLRTGAVLRAPALEPLDTWQVEQRDGAVRVAGRKPAAVPPARQSRIGRVVIVGAGAAGSTAARTLRREGYTGEIQLVDPDEAAPYDRPNLSKDYLAGTAPAEWLPLWGEDFCARERIERIVAHAEALDAAARTVRLADGRVLSYDVLLLAAGASPVRPPIPGAELPHVHVLRSWADSRGLLALPASARVVIAGASFIGLEAAAALRTRGLAVSVVAPEAVPFGRVLGAELGAALRELHEEHGVHFRLGRTLARIEPGRVVLDDGSAVAADAVLLGVGVRPSLELAQSLPGVTPGGIEVDAFLQTRAPGVYAAGDGARYPDPRTGESIRVEHWAVAERQGAAAARNLLGAQRPFRDVPFFWTQQYDLTVSYVGHASTWDEARLEGHVRARDCRVAYLRDGRVLAVATIGRDRESLRAELAFENEAPLSPTISHET